MLKMTKLSDSALKKLRANNNKVVRSDDDDRNLSKKLKNAKSEIQTRIRATREPIFLPPNAKKAFIQLRQVFTKALILRHFDSECHIQIETNASRYAIRGVLSQLTFDHLISD